MRQQGCRQCEQLTGGDCGQHGPLFIHLSHAVPGTQTLPDRRDAEIARLWAEMKQLRLKYVCDLRRLTQQKGQEGITASLVVNVEKAMAEVMEAIVKEQTHALGAEVERLHEFQIALRQEAKIGETPRDTVIRLVDERDKAEAVVAAANLALKACRRAVTLGVANPEWFETVADELDQALAAWDVGKEET